MTRVARGWVSSAAIALTCVVTACSHVPARTILAKQATAWNRGDIDEFMAAYWKDDRLSFASGGETTYGWQATRDRYHRRYPTPAEMGKLQFELDEVREYRTGELGRQPLAALVRGRWYLTRSSGILHGNFTLIFECHDGQWVITHDHTSVYPAAPSGSTTQPIETVPAVEQ